VDAGWLLQNVRQSWRQRRGPADVVRQLLLRYASRLPQPLRRPDWVIGCRFPPPIGELRLLLRDNAGSDLFVFSEVFEQQYYRLPLDPAPATILDLGANIGLSAVYFARSFPGARLACVEPVPENLEILRRNLAMNEVTAEVFAAAADIRDGTATMRRSTMAYGHQLLTEPEPPCAEQFEVPTLTVASLLERLGWDRIGLVKIDIEGHETMLLREAADWLHRVDALCLEYHADGGERHLEEVAQRYRFLPPQCLPGGLWFLMRQQV
jgi:FkbM family methyltransferase